MLWFKAKVDVICFIGWVTLIQNNAIIMSKPKLDITTTAARTFSFFKGQTMLWNETFDVCAISSEREKLIDFAQT